MFINPQICIALFVALSTVAFARPKPQNIVVTVTVAGNPPASTPAPVAVDHQAYSNSPTPSSAPVNPPPAGSNKSKRGLAYNSTSPSLDIFNPYPKITWGHNWAPVDFNLPDQFEFIATLTDVQPDTLQHWESGLKTALARGSSNPKYLMSFNEPDQPGAKAQMDAAAAARAHQQYMNPHSSSSVKIGAPSVTNGVVNGMGLAYLANFLQACNGACVVDFIVVHWYGCDNSCPVEADADMFKRQMTDAIKAAGSKPVWVAEFQRLGSVADQKTFMEIVLPWLDDPAQAQIERYAYFMAHDGYLTSGGKVNELGIKYAS